MNVINEKLPIPRSRCRITFQVWLLFLQLLCCDQLHLIKILLYTVKPPPGSIILRCTTWTSSALSCPPITFTREPSSCCGWQLWRTLQCCGAKVNSVAFKCRELYHGKICQMRESVAAWDRVTGTVATFSKSLSPRPLMLKNSPGGCRWREDIRTLQRSAGLAWGRRLSLCRHPTKRCPPASILSNSEGGWGFFLVEHGAHGAKDKFAIWISARWKQPKDGRLEEAVMVDK